MSKELGVILRKLRKERGLTQRNVADVLCLERSTYAYYESGTTEPSLNSVGRLAKLYNVPLPLFFTEEPDEVIAPESDRWISVNEKLPEKNQAFLAVVYGEIQAVYPDRHSSMSHILNIATHWMPMIELPKEICDE